MTRLVACASDDPRFVRALADAGLPRCAQQARCFALDDGDGFGAIEGEGSDYLLRSVVVPAGRRGTGRGAALVAALAEMAREAGAERLWLLTTEAAEFFARCGWASVDRTVAPSTIRANEQFTTLCPASATLMLRELGR
jgi:amino-acid N-acetyltransferase